MPPLRVPAVATPRVVRCPPASPCRPYPNATLASCLVARGATAAAHPSRLLGAASPWSAQCWPPAPPTTTTWTTQVRGKKTKTVVKLEDLPQGPIDAEPLPVEESLPAYPTVVLQARRNMQNFANCVLLTRVGGFYELYFEHAQEYGPLLNLKVAVKRTNAGTVPMAGFPFFQLDRFLKILVQDLNRYVAIAEEFPNNASEKVKSGGLMHDRKVARIITPGTLIDENFMDPYASNYVLAVHLPPTGQVEAEVDPDLPLGLAWLDLSTGHFFTQAICMSSLGSALSRISPREVILDEDLESQKSHDIFSVLAEDRYLLTYAPQSKLEGLGDWTPMLESEIPAQAVASFTHDEIKAGSLLLHYVRDRLQGANMKLQPPQRYDGIEVMTIDKNSMRALEIKQTIRDSTFRGSLLHAIRRTVTKSGARLLNEWLSAPSTSLEVINFRHDLVARFIADENLRENIILLLRASYDSQRLVQKFALGRGDPDDLLDLAKTIKATDDIVSLLRSAVGHSDPSSSPPQADKQDCLATMIDRISLDKPLELARRIRESVDEEGLVQKHQLEDSEAGEIIALAQEIVSSEGTTADDTSGLSKKIAPSTSTSTSTSTSASAPRKRSSTSPTSLREYYGEDNEAWIMRPQASPTLARLHADLASLVNEKAALAARLQAELSAPSLTLKWTPGLGHICHVKGKDARNLSSSSPPSPGADTGSGSGTTPPTLRTLSSSRSTRSFHHPQWSSLGQRLDQARLQIRAEEQRVFAALRTAVVRNLVRLRRNAAVLDELDVTSSFARLALERGLVRPSLDAGTAHRVVAGRHPTVEGGLAELHHVDSSSSSASPSSTAPAPLPTRTFVPNDCLVGAPGHGRLWLITGPNMAGKSTFLRQNALVTILAQCGSYVPAAHAELGLVDAVFSRVGSADDLYRDRSTFMVEMLETAEILRRATPRSFVIMDEIGRGTTPEDGAAVAFAALHHLVTVNRCRTLFATHFHLLADMVEASGMRVGSSGGGGEGNGEGEAEGDGQDGGAGTVEMYCTDVKEDGQGGFYYDHRLRKGINRQSHALKVARLAGLPEPAIKIAKQVLDGKFTTHVSARSA